MRLFILLVFTLFVKSALNGQNIAIGQWSDHLSYKSGISVAQGNGKIFCLTKGGIIIYNISDNSIEKLSKINGLSDIEPTSLAFNPNNNKLLITYKNSNIDIIESNNNIINVVDLKIKSIIGSKAVNDVYCLNQYAYLSCSFGIVVVDMNNYTIKDTYIIGPGGNKINVHSTTADASYLYAATDSGIYKASLSSPNLADFAEWTEMQGIPKGIYNSIASLNGKVYTNFSKYLSDNSKNKDTLYVYDGSWNYFSQNHSTINSINVSNNNLLIAYDSALAVFDVNQTLTANLNSYLNKYARPSRALIDANNTLWIADKNLGLISKTSSGFESHVPDCPGSNYVNSMFLVNENLWVAPGKSSDSLFADGLYHYVDNDWKNLNGNHGGVVNFDTIYNISNLTFNPQNTDVVYASSLNGIIEINSGVPIKIYNTKNSTLKSIHSSGYDSIYIGGIFCDASGNLWVSNSRTESCISIKKTDGSWQSLNFSFLIGSSPNLGKILIDQNNQLWAIIKGKGLLIYNGNGGAPTTNNTKLLTTASGNGALPDTGIYCLTEDLDGKIWVGTNKGPTVFNTPQNIFNGQSFDSEQIYIQQDGNTQILLQTEFVQSIIIDGANRKWFGTELSGVFLMTADGTQQVSHFTAATSPLFSDNIKDIAINHKNGEVYFGTTKGILSYRGTATEGNEDFTDVYAFPNPVKPDYQGVIAIKGLVYNTTVKITDINGILVYETQSEGGQAIWDGKNSKGERVSSGVYMVFCNNEDGTKKVATKILFIN